MSITLETVIDPDGTLRYSSEPDAMVRVLLQRRNGTKLCPVELWYQGLMILSTDCDLRNLHHIENLHKHASTLQAAVKWHELLTAVAAALPDKTQPAWEPVVRTLSSYRVERKEYLWYPLLPKGAPASIEGHPKVGKSALTVKICCHLTTGKPFPTLIAGRPEPPFAPRHVVLFTYEDRPEDTIKPRVLINGGNMDLFHIAEGKRHPDTREVIPMSLQDLAMLERILQACSPALMIFDPMQSFFGDVDMNKPSETRPVLDAVSRLCKTFGCTPLYIRHHGKTPRSNAAHASLGTVDINAGMRSVLTVYKDPDVANRRVLAHTLTNGALGPSLQFLLTGVTHHVLIDADDGEDIITVEDVQVDWDGLSEWTSDDLHARLTQHDNNTQEATSALEGACEFLRAMLGQGAVLADDIHKAARKAGVARNTLYRAKSRLDVKARRHDTEGLPSGKWPWVWMLPPTNSEKV